MFLVLFWIVFGGLVGLIVGILQGKTEVKSTLAHIAVGIVGGLLGGYFSSRLTAHAAPYDISGTSMMFAVFGALLMTAIIGNSIDDPPGQNH